MTLRLNLAIGILGLLVLAGCESRFEEHEGTGIPAKTKIGTASGSGSHRAPGARAAIDEADEDAPGGVIETEIGYPVQDDRATDITGF